jgi:uncharacterized protein
MMGAYFAPFKFSNPYWSAPMLELRPNCECCDKNLPPESCEAFICTFECTFCSHCAKEVLKSTCPNCSGNLVARPVRPAALLIKYPASSTRVIKPHGSTALLKNPQPC